MRLQGPSSPFTSQVAVAAETEAFAFPTPMPSKTAWVAREPERLEAKAWRRKEVGEEKKWYPKSLHPFSQSLPVHLGDILSFPLKTDFND